MLKFDNSLNLISSKEVFYTVKLLIPSDGASIVTGVESSTFDGVSIATGTSSDSSVDRTSLPSMVSKDTGYFSKDTGFSGSCETVSIH